MRAATALVSFLSAGSAAKPLWRADELSRRDTAHSVASGFADLDRELPDGGWPQGQLVELLLNTPGLGELSLLAPALARAARAHRPCVWVLPYLAGAASNTLPYPPALADTGIDVERSIFVRPATPRESLWAIEQSLRIAHLGALIGWLPAATTHDVGFRALRRLQLLAQRHQALVFLLRDTRAAATPSPAVLRLQLACADGLVHVTVLKRRGRPLLEPVTLQVHPAYWRNSSIDAQLLPAPPTPGQRITIAGKPAELPARRWSLQAIFRH